MQNERYTQVAFIMLRVKNGEPLINVPLYVKVKETTKDGVSTLQKEMIHKVSEIMNKRYENQIREYFTSLKKE